MDFQPGFLRLLRMLMEQEQSKQLMETFQMAFMYFQQQLLRSFDRGIQTYKSVASAY